MPRDNKMPHFLWNPMQRLHMGVSKNRGKTPHIIKKKKKIGVSLIFTIHFGGPPLFLETPISVSCFPRNPLLPFTTSCGFHSDRRPSWLLGHDSVSYTPAVTEIGHNFEVMYERDVPYRKWMDQWLGSLSYNPNILTIYK